MKFKIISVVYAVGRNAFQNPVVSLSVDMPNRKPEDLNVSLSDKVYQNIFQQQM